MKIHTCRRAPVVVNRRLVAPKVGIQSLRSHFLALFIRSLPGELNYSQSNLASHLLSAAGPNSYLHEAAIELSLETEEQEKKLDGGHNAEAGIFSNLHTFAEVHSEKYNITAIEAMHIMAILLKLKTGFNVYKKVFHFCGEKTLGGSVSPSNEQKS